MSVPLSASQHSQKALATGMFGGEKQVIAPRGSYVVQGVGDPNLGYAGEGYFWNNWPALVAGQSRFADISTETGVPVGTPVPQDQLKVGGGPTQAEVPDYGGTAAY